jgi:choline-sulfatase
VCSPNRAAILTGLYPHSAGVQENKVPLPRTSITMAEMLAPREESGERDYDCGYFGKWHLERRDAFGTMPEYPSDGRGDNHYFGKGGERRYGTDVITEDAIAFMRKPRDKPFYIYVSYYPPHPPYSAPPQFVERYRDVEDKNVRVYYAMCTKVDENVGELLKTLDELGVADQTLVVFTTDHGHNFDRRWNDHEKRLCYDPAARIPLLMRFPGVIPAGRVAEGIINSVDLTPTILALVRQPIPQGLHGLDLSAMARGTNDAGREYTVIENVPFPFNPDKGQERCVVSRRWKLILSNRRGPELFDLQADPEEETNLWERHGSSETTRQMIDALARWSEQTKDDLGPKLLAALP